MLEITQSQYRKKRLNKSVQPVLDLYLVILFLYQDADLFPGPFEVRRGKHVVKLDRNVFQSTFHNFQHICREIVVR